MLRQVFTALAVLPLVAHAFENPEDEYEEAMLLRQLSGASNGSTNGTQTGGVTTPTTLATVGGANADAHSVEVDVKLTGLKITIAAMGTGYDTEDKIAAGFSECHKGDISRLNSAKTAPNNLDTVYTGTGSNSWKALGMGIMCTTMNSVGDGAFITAGAYTTASGAYSLVNKGAFAAARGRRLSTVDKDLTLTYKASGMDATKAAAFKTKVEEAGTQTAFQGALVAGVKAAVAGGVSFMDATALVATVGTISDVAAPPAADTAEEEESTSAAAAFGYSFAVVLAATSALLF